MYRGQLGGLRRGLEYLQREGQSVVVTLEGLKVAEGLGTLGAIEHTCISRWNPPPPVTALYRPLLTKISIVLSVKKKGFKRLV